LGQSVAARWRSDRRTSNDEQLIGCTLARLTSWLPDRTAVAHRRALSHARVLPHIEQTVAPYVGEFLSLARIEKLFVYGDLTPEVRAKLDGFGAIYLAPFEGFTR
jgi:hypothetical protein